MPDVETTVARWGDHELFKGTDGSSLSALLRAMQPAFFAPGTLIVRQGAEGQEMYLLDQGNVQVTARGQDGTVRYKRVLSAPAIFGEMSLVAEQPHDATVVARTEARCMRVNPKDFSTLTEQHPGAAAFLTRVVGKQLMTSGGIQQVGKYQIMGRLGRGGVATVFEGRHPILDQRVAIKMLHHDRAFHTGFAEQFKREAKLIARLSHPNIVRVIDVERAYGTHFIVMEKVAGTPLDELIDRRVNLGYDAVRQLMREVANALHHSHDNGVLHRDVKPSNVVLTPDGVAKLLDFNIATRTTGATARQMGMIFGTPAYMAPEQFEHGGELDGRTDLYSLGLVAYELVTGELPFRCRTFEEYKARHQHAPLPDPRHRRPDLPADVAEFILRSTRKLPEDRFPSCKAAGAVLTKPAPAEVPPSEPMDLTTLALSYPASKRAGVADALARLERDLRQVGGVKAIIGGRPDPDR